MGLYFSSGFLGGLIFGRGRDGAYNRGTKVHR